MNRDFVRRYLMEFHADLIRHVEETEKAILPLRLAVPTTPENVVLLTMGRFEQGYYTVGDRLVRAIALGDWKRELAPPSILEFFLTLLLRQSIGLISPTFRSSGHLGTKGCLFDFTDDLSEARLKTMQGFVCCDCRRLLAKDNLPTLIDTLLPVLDTRSWLGSSGDPKTPAGVVAKLGHDLFLTRGVQPSWWESILTVLRNDGIKELLKVAAIVLLTAVLVVFGLKGVS